MTWIDEEDLHQIRRMLRTERPESVLRQEVAERVRPDSEDVVWRSLFLRWAGEVGVREYLVNAEALLTAVGEAVSAADLVRRLEDLAAPPWDSADNVLLTAAAEVAEERLAHAVAWHREDSGALVELLQEEWLLGAWSQQLSAKAADYIATLRDYFLEAVLAEQRAHGERTRRQLGDTLPGVLGKLHFLVDVGGRRWEFGAATSDALAALQALDSLKLGHEALLAYAAIAAEQGRSEQYTKTLAQWAGFRLKLVALVSEDTYRLSWQTSEAELARVSAPLIEQLRGGLAARYAQFGDALLIALPERRSLPFLQLLQGAAVVVDGIDASRSLGLIEGHSKRLRVTQMHRAYKRPFVRAVRAAGWKGDIRFVV